MWLWKKIKLFSEQSDIKKRIKDISSHLRSHFELLCSIETTFEREELKIITNIFDVVPIFAKFDNFPIIEFQV